MIDCNLQRQISNYATKLYTSPNVSTCHVDRRCALRDANSVYFNELPYRNRRALGCDYFTRPCYTFPDCCGGRKRCC